MKRIGMLGSGAVAKALTKGFTEYGYDVCMGTRNKAKLKEWCDENAPKVRIGSFEQAAVFGEILVLAIKGKAAVSALDMAGPANLVWKTIIDATNPLSDDQPENGMVQFFTTSDQSLMELLQHIHPKSNFVKAFNSIGSETMVDPHFETKPSMFICGDNEEAKIEATSIIEQFGWEVEDMGSAQSARVIEPLCILWCIPGFLRGEWSHAFKLLK